MGKLRFTLTYVLFWFIIVFSCLLAENFAFFSADHLAGMSVDSLIMLSLFVIFLLVVYYIRERTKNGITFDKILLPIIAIFCLVSIATVWWQGDHTFVDATNNIVTVSFSVPEKISVTLQIIIWCAVLYGILFVANRYSISKKWLKWLAFVYVIGVLACSLADIVIEFKDIVAIFNNTYVGSGLSFVIYNSNVWGNIMLVAIFSCIVLSLKKFRVFYYVLMIHFYIMILLSSSTTSAYIGMVVIIAYTLYEILSKIKVRTRYAAKLLFIYFSVLLSLFGLFAMMISLKVPLFVNLWSFLQIHIFRKDYGTLTSRTGIWASVFGLLCKNPIDLVFGLGYKTGNFTFMQYYAAQANGFPARSTHNGIVEITLRHGLFGLLFYFALLSMFIVGIVKLNKNKQYRVAYMYGICFLGILAHSATESTMLFVPNIEGTYLTLMFFLPVVNATKEKHFVELNKDVQKQNAPLVKPHRGDVLYFVGTFLLALIVALGTSFSIRSLYTFTPILVAYIVLISMAIIALVTIFIILIKMSKKASSNKLLTMEKEFFIPFVSSVVVGIALSLIFQAIFAFDLFSILLFTTIVVFFYMLTFSIFYKKENNHLYAFFDDGLTKVLQNVSREGPNE